MMIKKRQIFILVILLLLSFSENKSQEVSSNILRRVFLIKFGTNVGSSFTIDVQNRQYLITARHLAEGIKDGDNIELFHDNHWKPFGVKTLYVEPPEVDITVLVLSAQISPSYFIGASSAGLMVSQNTYFLGFPYGLSMEGRTLNNGYPLPFVKHGICSAFQFSTNKYSLVYVDGMNNPGFSGGPIIYVDQSTKEIKVAAVVSAYKNQEDKVFRKVIENPDTSAKNKTPREHLIATDFVTQSNAGLVVGYSIDSALQAISRNPIGPPVGK